MDITVKASSNSIQFTLPALNPSSGWQVNAVVGNTHGAFGTKTDQCGNRERLVDLSYNGEQKGYLKLTRYKPYGHLGHIEIEVYGHALLGDPTTNTPPVPALATICQLIKTADEMVAESEVGHLYVLPFPIKGEIIMGAHTVTVD